MNNDHKNKLKKYMICLKCIVHLSKYILKVYFYNITKYVFLRDPSTKVFDENININLLNYKEKNTNYIVFF